MVTNAKIEKLGKDLALELVPKMISLVVPVPAEITQLILKSFIELLTEEKNILDEQLTRLTGSFYKDGIEFLTHARNVKDPERRKRFIEKALERFITATNVKNDLFRIKSQFYIGTCYDLLGEVDAAGNYFQKAYYSAKYQALKLIEKPRKKPIMQEKLDTLYRQFKSEVLSRNIPHDTPSSTSSKQSFDSILSRKWQRQRYQKWKSIMRLEVDSLASVRNLSEEERNELRELGSLGTSLSQILTAHGFINSHVLDSDIWIKFDLT